MELLFVLFLVAFVLNVRASFKLGLDWKGMLTTVGFVREAYARLDELPGEEALEREPRAPVFLHLVPAYQEPDIAATVSALAGSPTACRPISRSGSPTWSCPAPGARPTSSTGRCAPRRSTRSWAPMPIPRASSSASATPTRCPTRTPTAGSPIAS